MKVFFSPSNTGHSLSSARVLSKSSMPLQSVRSLSAARRQVAATSTNVGNLIHCEAAAKTFDIDLNLSSSGAIERLYKVEAKCIERVFHSKLNSFDAVVISVANLISLPLPGREVEYDDRFNFLTEMTQAINIPIIILGMGMQNPIPDTSLLPDSIKNYLRVLNKKAAIWGVRGVETEQFLHSLGFFTAEALGCPSLYVYPESISSIKPLVSLTGARGITAGYLDRKHLLGANPERISALAKLSKTLNLSYVFQNDIYTLRELENIEGLFEDSTNVCDKKLLEEYFNSFGHSIDFTSYHFFRDPRSWREFARSQDFFFGDRFHGGIVALQVGRPSLFVWNDLRVRELTNYFNIPNISLSRLLEEDPLDALSHAASAKRLAEMNEVYEYRAQHYFNRMSEHGLSPNHQRYVKVSRKKSDTLCQFVGEVEAVFTKVKVSQQLSSAWKTQELSKHDATVAERVFSAASDALDNLTVLELAEIYAKHFRLLANWSEGVVDAIAKQLLKKQNYEAALVILATVHDPENTKRVHPSIAKMYSSALKGSSRLAGAVAQA